METNKVSVVDVVNFLYTATLSPSERKMIIDAYNGGIRTAKAREALNFYPGLKASFTDRYGMTHQVTVTKVNRSTIVCTENCGPKPIKWHVSPSLLRKTA